MPTYNLVDARRFANFHLDQGCIAQINQVSEHKFEVQLVETDVIYEFDEPKLKRERFVFNQGWHPKPPRTHRAVTRRQPERLAGKTAFPRWIAVVLVLAVLVALLSAVVMFALPKSTAIVAQSESSAGVPPKVCKQPSELDQTEVATLLATGDLELRSANFHQLAKLELGGVEQLKLNFTCNDKTIYGSLALIKRTNTWQIEKWVPLN